MNDNLQLIAKCIRAERSCGSHRFFTEKQNLCKIKSDRTYDGILRSLEPTPKSYL